MFLLLIYWYLCISFLLSYKILQWELEDIEVSQRQIYEIAYIQNLKGKKDTNEITYRTETDSQETNIWLPKGEVTGRDTLGVRDWNIYTIVFKIDNQQGPTVGFPGGRVVKNPPASALDAWRRGFDPWVGKIPWRRKWQPTPVCLPWKFHGQQSQVGYSS